MNMTMTMLDLLKLKKYAGNHREPKTPHEDVLSELVWSQKCLHLFSLQHFKEKPEKLAIIAKSETGNIQMSIKVWTVAITLKRFWGGGFQMLFAPKQCHRFCDKSCTHEQ